MFSMIAQVEKQFASQTTEGSCSKNHIPQNTIIPGIKIDEKIKKNKDWTYP